MEYNNVSNSINIPNATVPATHTLSGARVQITAVSVTIR